MTTTFNTFSSIVVAISVAAMLCVGCVTGGARVGGEPLPDYPRKSVSELQEEALKQLGAGSDFNTDGFVVVGRVISASDSGLEARWLLVDQVVACCAAYEVALPLTENSELKDEAYVAVYGHLQGKGARPAPSSRTIGGRIMDLGKANATITVELVVSADKVLHGDELLDLIKSDYVGEFRELLEDSGLEATVRAAEEVTLLVPHDSAFAGDDTPKHDAKRSILRHFVLGHFAKGSFAKEDLLERDMIVMMNGDQHAVEWINGKLHIGGSRVIMANLFGQNGVAHIITPARPVSAPSSSKESSASAEHGEGDGHDH